MPRALGLSLATAAPQSAGPRDLGVVLDDDELSAAEPAPTTLASKANSIGWGLADGGSKALAGIPMKLAAGLDAGTQLLPESLGGTKGPTTFGKEYSKSLALLDEAHQEAKAENPDLYSGGNTVGGFAPLLIPGLGAAKGATTAMRFGKAALVGAGLGGASAIGHDEDPLTGAGIGLLAGLGGEGVVQGLASGARAVGRALSPRLQAYADRLASMLHDGDPRLKAVEKTARSATSAAGNATARGSRLLEDLSGRIDGALSPAEVAANRAALATPEAQALGSSLAGSVRSDLPGQLGHIDAAKALAAQTEADAVAARAAPWTVERSKQALGDRGQAMFRRYMVPAAIGSASGYLLGDEHSRGPLALSGLAAGMAGSVPLRAGARWLSAPEGRHILAAKSLEYAQRLAGYGPSGALGRFAPILQDALKTGGPDGFAAAHFSLQTNPEYQQLVRREEDPDRATGGQ
jgi:hypothetical protein